MTLFKFGFLTLTLIDVIDIILVTWIFIKVYQYFRETRAGQMLIGLVILGNLFVCLMSWSNGHSFLWWRD